MTLVDALTTPGGGGQELITLDVSGDSKITWSVGNVDEVQAARELFNTLKKKGYAAYRVGRNGEKADTIREFDPEAERIIMAKPFVGG